MTNDKSTGSHNASPRASKAWQDAPDLSDEERQALAALQAAAEAMLEIPKESQTPFANPAKFHGPIGLPDAEMTGDSDDLVAQIQRDFSFLVNEFAFTAGKPQHGGGITFMDYKHAHMVIWFSVREGEWQASAWPAAAGDQSRQVSLDGVVAYLTQPPINFAADQARPGLSQSEALSQLARQLAPCAAISAQPAPTIQTPGFSPSSHRRRTIAIPATCVPHNRDTHFPPNTVHYPSEWLSEQGDDCVRPKITRRPHPAGRLTLDGDGVSLCMRRPSYSDKN